MSEGLDLNKVISLIMENPRLVSEIMTLAKSDAQGGEEKTTPQAEVLPESPPLPEPEKTSEAASTPTYQPRSEMGTNRHQLLHALKPYMSEGRGRAIDSMLTIADILDMMKTR